MDTWWLKVNVKTHSSARDEEEAKCLGLKDMGSEKKWSFDFSKSNKMALQLLHLVL